MAVNPMQKAKRSSFMAGFFIMFFISLVIVGFLIFLLFGILNKQREENEDLVTVYILNKEIKAGEEIKITDVLETSVPSSNSSLNPALTQDFIVDKENNKKKVAKIDLTANTIITKAMIGNEDSFNDSTRLQEYNMIMLPSKLAAKDFIDIRITLPSGQDYIVVSKKCVEYATEDTMWIRMNEEEILMLNSALVEAYKMRGASIYATTYVEAGLQKTASTTYIPSQEIYNLIDKDPNIVNDAKNDLKARISAGINERNSINAALNSALDPDSSVETKIMEQIQKSQENRRKYLESLGEIE